MILITGATGNIGTELVKRLVIKRTPIRIITRDEKKIAHLGPEVGGMIGDRHEPSVVQRAVQDVEKVFMLSGPFDIDHEADRLLISEAKMAGVRQIVLISSSNVHLAGKNSVGVFHREKEMLVEKSNTSAIASVMSRSPSVTQNTLTGLGPIGVDFTSYAGPGAVR